MAQFYIPRSGKIVLRDRPFPVFTVMRGIHEIPDALADSHEANAFGIKPVSEMTDDEWRMLGLKKPDAPTKPVDPAPMVLPPKVPLAS